MRRVWTSRSLDIGTCAPSLHKVRVTGGLRWLLLLFKSPKKGLCQMLENYADLDTASNSCRQTFSKFESCTEDKFGPKKWSPINVTVEDWLDRPVYDTTRCLLDLAARPNTNGALCYAHDDLEKESMIKGIRGTRKVWLTALSRLKTTPGLNLLQLGD